MMDSLVVDTLDRIASEAGRFARYSKRNTITSREIQTAVRLLLSGELLKHAVSEGTHNNAPTATPMHTYTTLAHQSSMQA